MKANDKKPTPEEYKLIPMSEITDEARKIAVAWMECKDKDWIGQKHKLASDIMNYADLYHKEKLKEELIKFQIWHEDKLFKCHALEMAVEHNVDEYLKTKG